MKRSRIGYWCYSISGVLLIVGGMLYFACPTIMPYHKQALGMNWDQLTKGLQILLISSIKGVGAGFLNTGIATLFILNFARDSRWSNYCLLLINMCWLLPLCLVAIWIAHETGAPTPWIAPLLLIIVVLTGFFALSGQAE